MKEFKKTETVIVQETKQFTNLVVKNLNQCKMQDVAPFIGYLSDTNNLSVLVTDAAIICKTKKDFDIVKDLFQRSVMYN
jgi:hypothetical protein